MLVKTMAIVVSSLKYQEKSLIVKCFTADFGMKSYFVRDAFSGKKSSQRRAYFQPLTVLEIEALHRNKGRLETLKELEIAAPFHSIHSNVFKSTIVMFLSEVLHHTIKEEEKNQSLFDFLEHSLLWLDNNQNIANFHLVLMLEATKYLGFYPDMSSLPLPILDLKEGVFITSASTNSISEQETALFKRGLELEYNTEDKTFNYTERQLLLKLLIDYYSHHIADFRQPKSLEILKEVFHSDSNEL